MDSSFWADGVTRSGNSATEGISTFTDVICLRKGRNRNIILRGGARNGRKPTFWPRKRMALTPFATHFDALNTSRSATRRTWLIESPLTLIKASLIHSSPQKPPTFQLNRFPSSSWTFFKQITTFEIPFEKIWQTNNILGVFWIFWRDNFKNINQN